ncbi:MAG: LPXTG cell wall anchor domain-containing protein, partial [Microbacterium sp.]
GSGAGAGDAGDPLATTGGEASGLIPWAIAGMLALALGGGLVIRRRRSAR